MATYSKLHQQDVAKEPVNDAVVAGTFGGEGVMGFEKTSLQQQNSYVKSPVNHQTSIASNEGGMMSFNPSNPMKKPTQTEKPSDDMPAMSFGGAMLANIPSERQSLI